MFAYDVQHYLDFLLNKEKLISVEEFNSSLVSVRLSDRDSRNRPKKFKVRAKNTKYEGNAGSLRVLSRILTTILSDVLENSKTHDFFIKLHELGEIITAPSLTKYDIFYVMEDIITDYLDLRTQATNLLQMSSPKPKHHFLSHYPQLYYENGPLISVWAMRMESKHTYMKSVLRTAKNFKNVAYTCATRHQMALISHHYHGLFSRSKFVLPDDAPTTKDVLCIVKDNSLKVFYSKLGSNALVLKKVKIYGTMYACGKVVVIENLKHGLLKVGMIRAMCFDDDVQFLVTSYNARQSRFGYYVTTEVVVKDESIAYLSLYDYYPLDVTGVSGCYTFSLHHFIRSSI